MAGLSLVALLVLVPAAAWIVSLFVFRSALESRAREMPHGAPGLPRNRIAVLMGYGAIPVILGIVLWVLLGPQADRLASSSLPGAADLESLLLWATVAYAVAACATSAARSTVFLQRVRQIVAPRDFPRVLVLTTIPDTPTIYALVIGFLVMGVIGGFPGGGSVPSGAATSSVFALQLFALSTLAMPVAAHVSGRVKDIGGRGFRRILLIMNVAAAVLVLGLILVFLSLVSLPS